MKKIYTVLSALFVVLLLTVGVVSLFSSNDTAQKPKLTFSGLLNGSYANAQRTYYAEAFPQSESLKNMNTRLNGFYKFSGLSGENDVSLIINANGNAADHGASLDNPQPLTPDVPDESSAPSSTSDAPTEPSSTEPTQPSSYVEDGAVIENLGAALLIGNRAVEVPYADYDSLEDYSAAVTGIADALGSSVRTFSIAVPNGAEFYTTEEYHSGVSSQVNMIDYVYEKMGTNVHTVDAYSKLAAHIDEYIYFRTDHHWTQLGAYYAYTAFCEEAGFKAEPLSKFETGEYTNFVGSMYNFLADYPQAQILREDPDTLEYYEPFVEAKARYYTDATLNEEYIIGVISYVGDSVSNKYLCYLGGDHPVTIIRTDVEDGPVCLLLKESYGNAFAPWLTSHYSKIIVVDPREFNRDGKPSLDLVSFAKEQGVNDCIVLNYPMMLSSDSYISWLNRLVQ
ncbi:MAG: DHHW family protein [Faecousia sp.]